MKIQVAGLSQGVHRFSFRVPAAQLALGEKFTRDVDVDAILDRTATELSLEAEIRTGGRFTCDRCVADFDLALTPSYRMLYVWNGADASHLDPSEVQVVSPSQAVVDLTEDVRQTILLAVPFKLLCREDCRGLCPGCGADLNREPCRCADAPGEPPLQSLREALKNRTLSEE
ncbi:MAG: hypothetical protein H6Q29_104 [Bacteroidetes bacterium]|nr:hypothetical protein [Bacteroidota bacterium]